jgi:hypothetical protein
MEALRQNGSVYMNTLDAFWRIEDGGVRGDRIDGVDRMENGTQATITDLNSNIVPIKVTGWTMEFRPPEPERINLYCMYALTWDSGAINVDPRVYGFGDTAVVFTNPNAFLERLQDALGETGRDFHAELVNYVPRNYVGDTGLFCKTEPYMFQSEWRLACYDGDGMPLQLDLGSLEDISVIVPTNELVTSIKIPP